MSGADQGKVRQRKLRDSSRKIKRHCSHQKAVRSDALCYLLSSKKKSAEQSSAELIVRYICSGPYSEIEGTVPSTKKDGLISTSSPLTESDEGDCEALCFAAFSAIRALENLGIMHSMQRCTRGR